MINILCILVLLIISIITIIIAITFKDFHSNKTKLYDNSTIDYKDTKTNPKVKTKLYKIFVIFSILLSIFLPYFVNSMIANFSDVYPSNENDLRGIPYEIANQIAIYVWPILIIYLIMLIMLIAKKTSCRKVYYPLSLFTLTVILFNLGIIYSGYIILWYFIILFLPLVILIVSLSILGNKLDNNIISTKTFGIILVSILLLMSIVPLLILMPSRADSEKRQEQQEQQKNKYEVEKNKIQNRFNNMLDSNFASINNLELNVDSSTITNLELLITTDNVPNNEMDFCNKLIDSYHNIKDLLNKYNYTSQTIHFEFTNSNPFAKKSSAFYQDGGYIRIGTYIDSDSNWYQIYLNPTPITIN